MRLGYLYNKCLKPKFAKRTSESAPSDFTQDLEDGLNEWFNHYFLSVYNGLYGTVTYPPSVVAVMGTPNVPLMIARPITKNFHLTSGGIINALSADGGFANLFAYIGTEISSKIITWSAEPEIPGLGQGVLSTAHFHEYGKKLIVEMSVLSISSVPDITLVLWYLFEDCLIDALNAIPTVLIPYTGSVGNGVFNGNIYANLKAD